MLKINLLMSAVWAIPNMFKKKCNVFAPFNFLKNAWPYIDKKVVIMDLCLGNTRQVHYVFQTFAERSLFVVVIYLCMELIMITMSNFVRFSL